MNLDDINNLTNKILSESTHQKDDFLNRWPYTSPYLEEEKKKVKNCGCGKNPCETYGDKAEPVAEGASHKGLEKVASKLEGASKAHAKQAAKIRDHVEDMKEELNPKLKAIEAKNKARVEAEGRAAAAERQKRRESADAYRKHKNEVMAKGGRPVDALDSWMRKKLGMEHVETVSKLIESNQFSEEELLKIIESM